MNILFLLTGLVVGALVAYLFINNKRKETEKQLSLKELALQQEQAVKQEAQAQADSLNTKNNELNEQITVLKIEIERTTTQLKAEQERNSQEATMREKQFEQQLKTVHEQFSNLATRVLNQASEQLKNTNNESFESITKPLKQNIEQLQTAIQATNNETAKHTASLSQQLKEMSEQTNKIDATATRLTNVIRGGNKTQGNWGERVLTDILDVQGFKVGTDYDVQQTITDDKGNTMLNADSGKRMIPDVILHYPNNEDVVIDSKMSIDAYYRYVNTDEDRLKVQFAADLVKSVRSQMAQLAKKDYSSYIKPPHHAIDFVIMFVPNDGALQLALATDPKLWTDAFNRQVFITGQQNLMAVLKMIQMAWRQYTQIENHEKVFGLAEELLKRVGDFIEKFNRVGNDIDRLHKSYNEAYNKAFGKGQTIQQKANQLKELGVKENANKPIPATEAELQIE